MGDLTGAISNIGDSIGNLFSSAPAAADQGFVDTGAFTTPLTDAAAAALPAADLSGISGANLLGGDLSGVDTGAFTTPLTDVASQAANIPFQMPGPAPGSQISMNLEQPSTGATPFTGAGPSSATAGLDTGVFTQPSAPTPATPATPATPTIATGGGAGGGGGATAQGSTLAGAGGGEADILKPGPDLGTQPPDTGGGVLNWLSNQLTGPGSLKNDLQMLAALGGLGMSAFKPNAVPGAGQTLSPSGTSTGQQVQNAQQQQQLASREAATAAQQQQLAAEAAATQPQQEQIAQQQQGISAQQTAQAPPLLATGQQQVAAAAAGQLTPAQQAQVTAALQANQQQIRAKYANLGLSGSTMEQSDLNQANLQAQAMIAGLLNQNQTQGLATVGAGRAALQEGGTSLQSASGDIGAGVTALGASSGDINQAVNAFNNAVSSLGSSSGTYLNILQQQLAQDQDLQKALAQMASSLGTSTALSQLGNAASTAGTTP